MKVSAGGKNRAIYETLVNVAITLSRGKAVDVAPENVKSVCKDMQGSGNRADVERIA